MRRLVVAALAATALGIATGGASAAPVDGAALLGATGVTDPVIQAQWGHDARRSHWRWGSRGWHDPRRSHWRWGSRGWHDPRRSHWRWGSRGRW